VQKKLELPRPLKPPELKIVERLVEAVVVMEVVVVVDKNNNLREYLQNNFL
jgi:hypothetical protein